MRKVDILRLNSTSLGSYNKNLFIALMAISFLATGGIFVKLSSLPPINTALYRVLFSIPILYPLVRKKLPAIGFKTRMVILLAGIFLALDLILWNISFHLTTVANANLYANLVPFTIIPVAYFVFKEKFKKGFFLGAAISIIGVILLSLGKINPTFNNYQGDILAFLTSIFYALFLLVVYKVRNKVDALSIMFISALGSVPVLFFASFIMEEIHVPISFEDLYPLLGLTILSQILGQGLLSHSLGKIRVSLSSLIVLAQPLIAAIYAFFIFNEKLTFFEWLGMILVLIGIFLAKKSNSS